MKRRRRSSKYVRASHWTNRLMRMLKTGWLVLCATILAGWLGWDLIGAASERTEHRQLLDTMMGIIAFPAGLLWIWISPALEPLAESLVRTTGIPTVYFHSFGPALIAWCGATLIGYIQWFWLLPYVFSLRNGK